VQPFLRWEGNQHYVLWVCLCVCVCVFVPALLSSLNYASCRNMSFMICPSVACTSPSHFSTLSHKWHYLQKKVIEHEMCVLFLYATLSKLFLIIKILKRDIIIKLCRSSSKVPFIVLRYSWNFNFLGIFSNIIKYQISWNFVQREPGYFMRTDRQKMWYS